MGSGRGALTRSILIVTRGRLCGPRAGRARQSGVVMRAHRSCARVTRGLANLAVLGGLAMGATHATADEALFDSRRLTPAGEYTAGIEGPAVDAAGTLFVVNFGRQGTIGKLVLGATQSQLFAALPAGSIGNGIRFDRDGRMYVADFKKHNIFLYSCSNPGARRRASIFIPTGSTSPTTLRSGQAVRSTRAIPASDSEPGRSGASRAGRPGRGAARSCRANAEWVRRTAST